jgi:hypothetical protein
MKRRQYFVLPKEAIDSTHLLFATLGTRLGPLRKMLCALTVPDAKTDPIAIQFFPSARQAQILETVQSFSLVGNYRAGGVSYSFNAPHVWITKPISGGCKGEILYFSTFGGSPAELQIGCVIDRGRGKRISRGAFRLTPCPLINAASIIMRSYTGSVRVKRVVIPTITLKSGVQLRFVDHFHSSEDDDGQTTTTSHLAAEFKATRKLPIASFP